MIKIYSILLLVIMGCGTNPKFKVGDVVYTKIDDRKGMVINVHVTYIGNEYLVRYPISDIFGSRLYHDIYWSEALLKDKLD